MTEPAPTLNLLDGNEIPHLGMGTWPLDDGEAEEVIRAGLELGYRLVDTATRYENETGVGRGIATADIPREEVMVTTKLAGADQGYEKTLAAFEQSRQRLGLEYVDLYLIHWPLPSIDLYVDTWRAFVHLREQGLVRSIGVSNFNPDHVEAIVEATGVWPTVNQIEVHPDFPQDELCRWNIERNIVVESWRPIGGRTGLLDDPIFAQVAERHERTPAQIALRWHVQRGLLPIPKSARPERLRENLDVFDFSLDADDMAALAKLDADNRIGGDPADHVEL